jgi:hypothetical protein
MIVLGGARIWVSLSALRSAPVGTSRRPTGSTRLFLGLLSITLGVGVLFEAAGIHLLMWFAVAAGILLAAALVSIVGSIPALIRENRFRREHPVQRPSRPAPPPRSSDPGWIPTITSLAWVPLVGPIVMLRQQRPALVFLRGQFLGLALVPFLFLGSLTFIASFDGKLAGPAFVAVVAMGVVSLSALLWLRSRPLTAATDVSPAALYRSTFFIGIASAEVPALWGFAGVVIGGSLWIYLIGLAFSMIGFALIAPTRGDIERRQEQLAAAGSPLPLLDALMTPAERPGSAGPE